VDDDDVSHTGDATLLRRVNESAVLEVIRECGPVTRADVARRLRLSLPTITRIVTDLMNEGLVREHSAAHSRGGRRPTLLEFNFRANLIIGVYIGRNMVGALADLSGTILKRATCSSLPGDAGLEALTQLICGLSEDAQALGIPLRGVGVGVPSIVEFPKGVVVLSPMLEWRNLPLRQRLEATLGVPVVVQNEINLLTLGESWRGAGRNVRNMVCISLGAGIGAGLVIDGQIYSGHHFAAGEIGYAVLGERFLGRKYESYGCLESEAGSLGIVRRAAARLAEGGASELKGRTASEGRLTVDAVFEAARNGDAVARAVVAETADYWTIALANLACILDPARIIISGELAEHGDLFLDHMRGRLQGLVPVVPEVVVSDLGVDAAVLGAVALVMRETSDAVFVHPSRAWG
jgi:predicted NBD/HSP70 family sugar kinase